MVSSINFFSYALGLFDDGVANVLGLETLRHGTNLVNYIAISRFGGDPKCGGGDSGSSAASSSDEHFKKTSEGYFYLFKDSQFASPYREGSLKAYFNPIALCFLPKLHTSLSGYALAAQVIPKHKYLAPLRDFVGTIGGFFHFLFIPTLKFRYSPSEMTQFEDDYCCGAAYRTKEVVEPWRIGFIGSLRVGFNSDWYSRARANPIKILTGVVQLTAAVALTIICVNAVIAIPV